MIPLPTDIDKLYKLIYALDNAICSDEDCEYIQSICSYIERTNKK